MIRGFYGHANTMVFTFTKDGKYIKHALDGGMKIIHSSMIASMKQGPFDVSLDMPTIDPESKEYRRDYYALRKFLSDDNKAYLGINEYLGYEPGETPGDIFCQLPEDGIPDMLFVWDEGYGGLNIPECGHVIWASNKVLPDKEQFEKIANRCFLLLEGDVLRKSGGMISRQISWERTASELIAELQTNPDLSYLLKAKQLLIPFGLDGGVFILPRSKIGQLEASLMLTHGGIEGAISDYRPGNPANNVFIFVVISAVLMTSLSNFSAAIKADRGSIPEGDTDILVRAIEMMMELGAGDLIGASHHSMSTSDHSMSTSDAVKWGGLLRVFFETGESLLNLPLMNINENDKDEITDGFAVKHRHWPAFSIPLEPKDGLLNVPDGWTVINSVNNREIYDVAFEYVQKGSAAIDGLPQFKLGALTTVDRWEIESYQNIRNLILDYDANTNNKRPLSIAVFGAPGSGKSFGVTEIATNILPGKIEKLEFNVSQFVSPMDLGAAFQKVRDVIVTGKLPLVFFDEFDSDKDGAVLGWIKSFLMPMQDGKFRDESGEHPLGKCILVFAGGTAADFVSFANTTDVNLFKNIKGPDFVSRLRGTINVVGPNPKNSSDQNHILRRALLLRGLIERDSRIEKTQVSPSIIRAMLLVPEFKHGVRSMEAILDMSRIEGGVWEPASLPFHSQLALHVDGDAFLQLVAKE